MVNDKNLGSYTELTLKNRDQFLGDKVLTFYCVKCGYIELIEKRRNNHEAHESKYSLVLIGSLEGRGTKVTTITLDTNCINTKQGKRAKTNSKNGINMG